MHQESTAPRVAGLHERHQILNIIAFEIGVAMQLIEAGEGALAECDSGVAQLMYDRAEHRCTAMLAELCRCGDDEADLLEPAFTNLESGLLHLGAAIGCVLATARPPH